MKTKRYNIFDFIHKAWRALLYDTALILQQTDFEIEHEAEKAIEKLETVLLAFENHAHHENTFVIPAIEVFEPQTANKMLNDHGQDEVLTHQLEFKIEAFRFAESSDLRIEIGRELMYLFIEFVAFNLVHMNMEEHVINEILWKNYSDEQLVILNQNIVKSVPADEMMFTLQWMIKGITNLQLAQLLNKLRTEMPEEGFEAVCYAAKSSLPEERWNSIKQELFENLEVGYINL